MRYMVKHHKRVHNGKDRLTGRKVRQRRDVDTEVKTRSIGKPNTFGLPILARPTRRHCNCSPEQVKQVNERLFVELSSVPLSYWDRTWNELTGAWKLDLPKHFVAKHRTHMRHFRAYARERIGQ